MYFQSLMQAHVTTYSRYISVYCKEASTKSISIIEQKKEDYICLTDMVRGEEGEDHIRHWMRNTNAVEFIGLWETLYNPDFEPVEIDTFRKHTSRRPACHSLGFGTLSPRLFT